MQQKPMENQTDNRQTDVRDSSQGWTSLLTSRHDGGKDPKKGPQKLVATIIGMDEQMKINVSITNRKKAGPTAMRSMCFELGRSQQTQKQAWLLLIGVLWAILRHPSSHQHLPKTLGRIGAPVFSTCAPTPHSSCRSLDSRH